MSDADGAWVHILLIVLRCFSQEKGLQERAVGEEGAAWHGHVSPALLSRDSHLGRAQPRWVVLSGQQLGKTRSSSSLGI